MGGLIAIIILFLVLGFILKLAFSAVELTFRLGFWVVGLVFSIFGWAIKGGFLVVLGILVVCIPIFLLSRKK